MIVIEVKYTVDWLVETPPVRRFELGPRENRAILSTRVDAKPVGVV